MDCNSYIMYTGYNIVPISNCHIIIFFFGGGAGSHLLLIMGPHIKNISNQSYLDQPHMNMPQILNGKIIIMRGHTNGCP